MLFSPHFRTVKEKAVQRTVLCESVSNILDEIEKDPLLGPSLKAEINQHMKSLENKLKTYFPEIEEEEWILGRNPFSARVDVAAILDDVQEEFLELGNISSAKDFYEEKSLSLFW